MKKILLIIMVLAAGMAHGTNYYVSTSGNNSYDGKSTINAWKTIAFAMSSASPVKAGDVVYVRAGNYGREYVTFTKSGVKMIGYRSVPGDAPSISKDAILNSSIDYNSIPVIDCQSPADGRAVLYFPTVKDITVANILVLNTSYAVSTEQSSGITLENVNAAFLGDPNNSYSGRGILLGSPGTRKSNGNVLRRCTVINARAEAIVISGDDNLVVDCEVYCNEGLNSINMATDYYIQIAGDNNRVENCFVQRIGNLAHSGHGITAYRESSGNVITNCTAVNMMGEGFCVRHRGAVNNAFVNCIAREGKAFVVRDGASNNTFVGCTATNANVGFRLFDTSEDGGAQCVGRNNTFKDCKVDGTYIGIYFDSEGVQSPADSNQFVNCEINNAQYLFYGGRTNMDNTMYGGKITNSKTYTAGSYPINMRFVQTTFAGNSFPDPSVEVGEDPVTPGGDTGVQHGYQTVEAATKSDFDVKCNALSSDGWEPVYGLIITDGKFYQQWYKP